MGFLVFLAVGLTVLAGVHTYLWFRLIGATTARGTRARRVATLALVLLALFPVAALFAARTLPLNAAAPVAWVGYLWLALMFYLFLWLLALELPRFAARRIVARRNASDPDAPDRRRLLARVFALAAGIAATATVGWGVRTATGPPRLGRVTVRLDRLDPRLSGFRIAVVGDLHLGTWSRRRFTSAVVDRVNDLAPDLVAIVGDLVDGSVAELASAAAPLARLRSRHGTFFVTGNHEYYSGVEQWVEHLPTLGVRVLRNERVTISRDGAALDLAGVDDVAGNESGQGPDLDAALAGRDTRRPVVLLAHQPVIVDEAADAGVDLQLSAHTHGGQMFPFHFVVRLQQPVLAGLAKVKGTWVYVSRGVGFWGPPVRVGAPPEISLVTLRSA